MQRRPKRLAVDPGKSRNCPLRLAGAQPGCPEPSDDEAAEMQVINDLQKYCLTLMNMEGQSSHIYGAAEATLDWLEAKHRQLESFVNT